MEWNSGMTEPIERLVPDDLYPISVVQSRRLGDQSVVLKYAGKFSSVKVNEAIG